MDENKKDGMNFAPKARVERVVKPGEFKFAVIGLDHGHIFGMCASLLETGAELKWVWDNDPDPARRKAKLEAFHGKFPQAQIAESEEQVLSDPEVRLIASACVTCDRAALGIRAMRAGKDYFTDKAPLTTLAQLEDVKQAIRDTGRIYACCYSERLQSEASIYAGQLIQSGAIGKVVQVIGMGPHRLNAPSRPDWFFEKEKYGGILCDIGSHQVEQFLYYTGARDACIVNSKIGNYHNPDHPELDDFGDCTLVGDNGATGYFRVDWLNPDGLSSWGDGRTFILGTEGYIEMRKNTDVARDEQGDNVYWVDGKGEHYFNARGKTGFPYFAALIRDCIDRTETAMPQEHTLKAAELCVKAELLAIKVK